LSEVVKIIAEEIRTSGAITFRRFMELALYCPVCGYYEKEGDTIGAGGDYYTSVSVGSVFGELLAFQFGEWLGERGVRSAECGVADRNGGCLGGEKEKSEIRNPKSEGNPKTEIRSPKFEVRSSKSVVGKAGRERVQIVEGGAHRGELAADILRWLRRRRPELFGRLEYWIVEPSERRRGWQERTLGEFGGKARWVEKLSELGGGDGAEGVQGVIFSNELLDAMPVRRLGWDAKLGNWFEWGVGMEGGKFGWTRMGGEDPTSNIQHPTSNVQHPTSNIRIGNELLAVLPDGFTVEICPGAAEWW
jgi:SAM-dependent MidA family methyltransferase